jgi:hypothetical protein
LIALLYALVLAAYSPAEPVRLKQPFIVQWEVKWRAPLAPTGHSRRFAKAEDAVKFELSAPLCKVHPEPCVAWIHTSVYTFDPSVKICALR